MRIRKKMLSVFCAAMLLGVITSVTVPQVQASDEQTIITKRQRKIYKPRKCLYFLGFLYARRFVEHHKKARIFYGN